MRALGIPVDSAERMLRRTPDAPAAQAGGEEDEAPVRRPPPPRVPNKAGISKENAGRKDPPRTFTVIRRFNRWTGYARTSSQRQE